MNFLDYFTEAKFREIPLSVSKKANQIARLYIKDYRNFNKQELAIYAKRITDPSWIDYLEDPGYTHMVLMTTTTIFDLETNKNKKIEVYVIYGNPKTSKDMDDVAEYNDVNRTIFLFDSQCKKLNLIDLEATILHEFTHGFQQYKNAVEDEEEGNKPTEEQHEYDYYLSPEEVDAYLTELAYRIRLEHSHLLAALKKTKSPNNLKALNKFLLELKVFVRSPLETYFVYRELSLPSSIKQSEAFLEVIADFTPYWNKFKTKMTKLFNELITLSKEYYDQQ